MATLKTDEHPNENRGHKIYKSTDHGEKTICKWKLLYLRNNFKFLTKKRLLFFLSMGFSLFIYFKGVYIFTNISIHHISSHTYQIQKSATQWPILYFSDHVAAVAAFCVPVDACVRSVWWP